MYHLRERLEDEELQFPELAMPAVSVVRATERSTLTTRFCSAFRSHCSETPALVSFGRGYNVPTCTDHHANPYKEILRKLGSENDM